MSDISLGVSFTTYVLYLGMMMLLLLKIYRYHVDWIRKKMVNYMASSAI